MLCVVVSAVTAPAQEQSGGAAAGAQQAGDKAESNDKFTLEGDAALWTIAIKADKTADFERILARLREALAKSDNPERRRQGEGWIVLRLQTPLPDGNVAYVHDIRPVVRDADYSVMRILYEAFPDEGKALYELYRGAFVRNVALASGTVVLDPQGPAASGGTPVAAPAESTPAPPATQPSVR